ncbi:hypothetical protein HWV62_36165 [Athelia sp. TMB]|nr:hypothetical protein HWV62_36165 [Athelia sp. TMB]
MDTDSLKCNRMTCRRGLADKAVVTMFSQLTVPMNCSMLQDFVLNRLNERSKRRCGCLFPPPHKRLQDVRPVWPQSFQHSRNLQPYQIHQENSFQHAVVRNINDKNAQLQKQLDNVIREANGEINLLNNKVSELETDLELERRKVRDLQDTSRDRDKEYQKLKAQHDKIKRKALLAGGPPNNEHLQSLSGNPGHPAARQHQEEQQIRGRTGMMFGSNAVDLGVVVGGMEANGNGGWVQPPPNQNIQAQGRNNNQSQRRQTFGGPADRTFHSITVSERSESADEVENLLMNSRQVPASAVRRLSDQGGWGSSNQRMRTQQRGINLCKEELCPSTD